MQNDKVVDRAPAPPVRLIGGAFEIHGRLPVIALAGLTLAMMSVVFAPYAIWPLAYVCLVPWLIAVCASTRARFVYLVSYLLGVAFFFINLRWLRFSTREGYIALCIWSGVHFLLAAWVIRSVYRRRRFNLAVLAPLVWIMTEFARSRTAVGFPWFLLGHSHYSILTMIQISDLVGAYGVSFVIVAVNGLFCELLLSPILIWRKDHGVEPDRTRFTLIYVLLLAGLTIIYGQYRLREGRFDEGPKIAVIQGDYPLTVESPEDPYERKKEYMRLLAEALPSDADLFVLPETPWSVYLNREYRSLPPTVPGVQFARECHRDFQELSRRENAYIVTGSVSLQYNPPSVVYPEYERFNSAFIYDPKRNDDANPQRYDKIHLVLFGEYVPFRNGPLHWLYRKLNALTPWGANDEEYSLTAGKYYTVFEMQAPSKAGQAYRFAVPICYEDAIPEVIGRFVTGPNGKKRVDFLLNISNDGWFWHSSELPQHLAVCAFRAVENRVGIARAVNTGISGFIDPDGRIRDIVTTPGKKPWQGVSGHSVSRVLIDARHTLYSRWGDWFAAACSLFGAVCMVDAVLVRWRKWRSQRDAENKE